MNRISKETTNRTAIKVGLARGMFATLKQTPATALVCICAYSANAYSAVPDISRVTQLAVTGVTQGQQIVQSDLPISIGASGIWNYEWTNTTAQAGLYPLTGTLFIDGQQAGPTAQLATFPFGPIPGTITATQSFNTSFGSFGDLALGSHTASVQVPGSQSSPSVNFVVVVPEPKTYAMMLARLGLLGWGLHRSRSTAPAR